MKKQIQTIEQVDLEVLKEHFETITFNSEFDLVYEKQIPNTGIVLVDGELNLLMNKKHTELKLPGVILGIKNMMENVPFKFKCRVKEQTKLILIPKSEIMKILKEKNSQLYKILKNVAA